MVFECGAIFRNFSFFTLFKHLNAMLKINSHSRFHECVRKLLSWDTILYEKGFDSSKNEHGLKYIM